MLRDRVPRQGCHAVGIAVSLLLLCWLIEAPPAHGQAGVAAAPAVPEGARLVLPRTLVAGEPVTASAVALDERPLAGVVIDVSGEDYITDDRGRISFVPPSGLFRLTLTLPGAAGRKPEARAEVIQWPEELDPAAPPVLTKVKPYAMPGVELTLGGGAFDGAVGGTEVTLDDVPLRLLAASPTTLIVATDFLTPLGEHPLVARTAAGTSEPLPVVFLQLRLQASAEGLERGDRAVATLWVEGTRDEICIRVTNEAPEVMVFKDGYSFLVESSGGKKNTVELKYTAVGPGHFAIRTEVVGEGGKECRNP